MLNKRVLVTGGAGFVGSHLCNRLLKDGCEVVCLDNYFTGSRANILPLMKNPLFEAVRHDIIYPYSAEVNEIYNLACPASPMHYQYNPIQTVKVSVMGAINMLESAKLTGAKVLQASTSEVYGNPHVHPQHEKYWGNVNPIGIRSCYDEGKRCAETLFMDYYRQDNVQIKIVRIFNTYGSNMHPNDGRVISNFIVQAIQGKDITIFGTGQQTRSFQYIDDLIEGILKMMNSPAEFIGPVNIGNPTECTILELAEKVITLTGSKSKIRFESLPEDDPLQRKPDITLAKTKLQWEPKVTLEDGLKETIGYFKTLFNI